MTLLVIEICFRISDERERVGESERAQRSQSDAAAALSSFQVLSFDG